MIEKDCKSLCLLAISTGIYNFPLKKCGKIFRKKILEFIDENEEEMKGKNIILCNFDSKTTEVMERGIVFLFFYVFSGYQNKTKVKSK